MRLPVYHVDAFADRAFRGNPASVVVLERWLPAPLMQTIAAENNLSETAFVVREGGAWGLRWFTPRVEVPLCGHATLATAFVLDALRGDANGPMAFATKSGVLTVTRSGTLYSLDFPAVPCAPGGGDPDAFARLIGAPVSEVHVTRDRYLCVLESPAAVRRVEPDVAAVARLPLPGLIVTAAGEAPHDFTSRYFAPAKGVDEDPVTGAAHCVLAPFWARRLGRTELAGLQASARGGRVACRVVGDRVLLAGSAVLYMQGAIMLDDALATQAGQPR